MNIYYRCENDGCRSYHEEFLVEPGPRDYPWTWSHLKRLDQAVRAMQDGRAADLGGVPVLCLHCLRHAVFVRVGGSASAGSASGATATGGSDK